MTRIAALTHDKKTGRLTVSLDLTPGDIQPRLYVDGIVRTGSFEPTVFGHLFLNADGQWGLPGLGYGPHDVEVTYTTMANVLGDVAVVNPPSTLTGPRLSPEEMLPHIYAAGFHDEAGMLNALSIAVGESGGYTKARNWLPSTGFRLATDVIGVAGPAAAWDKDHLRQGHSDRGLVQWNSKAWPSIPDVLADDPARTFKKMHDVVITSTGWSPWGGGKTIQEHYGKFWDKPVSGYPALRPLVAFYLEHTP